MIGGGYHNIEPGEWTDDTSLARHDLIESYAGELMRQGTGSPGQ